MSKQRVLFLCTGNSCRSQMAEGWARHLHPDLIEPLSAGVEPQGLNPDAVRVMAEVGIDIRGQRSKHMREIDLSAVRCVVTVCSAAAGEACPVLPGTVTTLHHPFDDPPRMARDADSENARLAPYRRVRDEIRSFVERLPEKLNEQPVGEL